MFASPVPLLAALLSSPAEALIYLGNPSLGFRVDRPAHDYVEGTVELDKVRVHHCGGGSTDYPVGEVIDPVEGYALTISGGNHCGLTFYWDSVMDIDGPTYTVRYEEATTNVTLAEEIDPVVLTPYDVISGSMSGYGPRLIVTID